MTQIEGTRGTIRSAVPGVGRGEMTGAVFGIDDALCLVNDLGVRIVALELQASGHALSQPGLQPVVPGVGIRHHAIGAAPSRVQASFCTEPAMCPGGIERSGSLVCAHVRAVDDGGRTQGPGWGSPRFGGRD